MSNENFLEEVYLSKRLLLVSLCRRMTGSTESGEDVVQAVFLKAWRYPGRFTDAYHCFRFLSRSCRNACIDMIRKEAAWKRAEAKIRRGGSEPAPMLAESRGRYGLKEPLHGLRALAGASAERQLPVELLLKRGAVVRYASEYRIKESTLRSRC